MSFLQGKIALVTGATRGIGKGIAIGLAEAGATVYITGRSLDKSLACEGIKGSLISTQQEIEKAGGVCTPVQVDHSDDQQIADLFQRIEQEQQGKLDILVNNVFAGVESLRNNEGKEFWHSEPEFWDGINEVGLRSHYVSSVYGARMMVKRKQGLIITISSWGGLSYIFGPAYGAGKSACDRLAADMAVELKLHNVTSLSLWPGIVGTEHISQMQEQNYNESFGDGYNWETPLFTGRVIARLANDPNLFKYNGKMKIVAELAQKYGVNDGDGTRPFSMRSLKFLLPFSFPQLRSYLWLIPDFKIPWILLLWLALKSPKL